MPAGFGLEADRDLRVVDHGRVLVGGTPLRILRLTPAGAARVREWLRGQPVGADPAAMLARRLVEIGMAHPVVPPRPTASVADVTVVVPVHDDADGVARTLDALHGPDDHRWGAAPSVIVVDDGSGDPAQLAAAVAGRARVLRRAGTRGPGAARTSGISAVTSEVVALVDAGVELRPAALRRLLEHLGDPAVVAVAPRVVSAAGTGRLARYEQRHSPLDMGERPAPVRVGSRVPYVPTACLVLRRSALVGAGGFDPALRYGEDVDLVWRLVAAGWTVRYEPEVKATHPVRPDARSWARQRFAYGSSAGPLAVRHGAAVAPLRMSGWSGAAWGFAAGGHPGVGLAVAAGSTAALARKLGRLDHPVAEAVRLAGRGHLRAGPSIAQAVRRAWLPAALGLAVVSRRARPAVAAAVLGPAVADVARARSLVTAALHLADDAAYCAGVWTGSWRARTWGALLPASSGRVDPPA